MIIHNAVRAFVRVSVRRFSEEISKIFANALFISLYLSFVFLVFFKTLVEIWLIMTYTNPRLRCKPEVASFVDTKRKQMHCIVIGHASLNHW